MFHVSFLVKEDKAQIDIDPAKNLPLIQPIKKSRTQATQSGDNSNKKQVRNQVCCFLSGVDVKSNDLFGHVI